MKTTSSQVFPTECPSRHFVQCWRGAQSHATPRKGTEDRGIDLKVWVRGILHTQPTHKHLKAYMPASIPGCRRPSLQEEDGGWEGQWARERDRWERERERWHTVLNVTTVLKTPTNLLARNENSKKGRGGKRRAKMVGGREMGRAGIESRKKRREFMYNRKRGWRWSHRWQDEKGFSSLLTVLLANNTQDDKRQNGHPHNYKGLTLSCLMGDQQHQVRCYNL